MKKALMMALMAMFAASLFAHGHGGWRGDRGDRGWRGRHGGRSWSGEWAVPQTSIPQAAQDFIGEYFPDRTVQFAGGDSRMYRAALSDGTEIAFTADGDWHEVKSYGVQPSVLPQEIAAQTEQAYPSVPILRAEKKRYGIEVKLANRMEMYFDFDGRLLGQKFDD